jgi:GR25 family glycosyltransferase involved in LPS biosynthesis
MKPCVFINLTAAAERRESLAASFAATDHAGWRLVRFEALGPEAVTDLPGKLTGPEKGCFASHRAAIGAHLEDEAPLVVLEDDALLSPGALQAVDRLLAASQEWDLLFTDVALCDLSLMVHLARRREALMAAGEHLAVNLAGRSFFGANAYVVRGDAKRRLHAMLDEPQALDRAYDLYLRDLGAAGRLKLGACFPFVTQLSPAAEASQIQSADGAVFDRTLNAYRRLMAVDGDLDACRAELAALSPGLVTEESRLVGEVFSLIAAPGFPLNR